MRRLLVATFVSMPLAAACTAPSASPRPQPEGRLAIALPTGAPSLNPNRYRDEFATTVLRNAFEPLVDLDGDLVVQPALAESWHNPDDQTWRFTLRKGVRLHDGRVLDAFLVEQSLQATMRDPEAHKGAQLNMVDAVKAVDARTLDVHTLRPFATLGNRLASVLIDFAGARPSDPPVGSGPYRIRNWSPSGDVGFEAFPDYWKGAPAISRLEFRALSDGRERAGALLRGEVDLIMDAPAEALDEIAGTVGLRTVRQRGLRVLYLGMVGVRDTSAEGPRGRNPFRDRRVREALAAAIDRDTLVKEPLGGHADVLDQLVAPEILGFHDHLPRIAFEPERARQLLEEAGWGHGFEVPLDYVEGRYRATESVVGRLAADLALVGIRVRPRGSTLRALQDRTEKGDPVLLGLRGWLDSFNEAVATYEYLVHTPGNGYGLANVSLYSNPDVDRLLQRASAESSMDDRRVLLTNVAEQVRRDLPVVPLYRQRDLYAFDAGLAFQPRLDRRLRVEQIRWASPPRHRR